MQRCVIETWCNYFTSLYIPSDMILRPLDSCTLIVIGNCFSRHQKAIWYWWPHSFHRAWRQQRSDWKWTAIGWLDCRRDWFVQNNASAGNHWRTYHNCQRICFLDEFESRQLEAMAQSHSDSFRGVLQKHQQWPDSLLSRTNHRMDRGSPSRMDRAWFVPNGRRRKPTTSKAATSKIWCDSAAPRILAQLCCCAR